MLFCWKITPRRVNEQLAKGTFLGRLTIIALKGRELIAQGIALGKQCIDSVRPVGAKALLGNNAFGLTGRKLPNQYTQGVTLGYWLVALTGRYLLAYNIPRALPWAISLMPFQGEGV